MSSFYNVIFGQNKHADLLLKILGLNRDDFYRYRDCFLTKDGKIAVYTRGGGPNRECYCSEYPLSDRTVSDEDGEWHFSDCPFILNSKIRSHPLYLYDEDDDFDNTYATFYFRVPDELKKLLESEGVEAEPERSELWKALLEYLKGRR